MKCPRCGVNKIDHEMEVYCEECWAELEADYYEGYTAGTGEASEEAERNLPDMQEPN